MTSLAFDSRQPTVDQICQRLLYSHINVKITYHQINYHHHLLHSAIPDLGILFRRNYGLNLLIFYSISIDELNLSEWEPYRASISGTGLSDTFCIGFSLELWWLPISSDQTVSG